MSAKMLQKACILLTCTLLIFSCDEPDTKAPEVNITSPTSGATLSEIVEITCTASDKSGIHSLNLVVDGEPTGLADSTAPYTFQWNTLGFQDGSQHVLKVLAFDVNDNQGESDEVTVVTDQTSARPQAVNITHVSFDPEAMVIEWNRSPDDDFHHYELFASTDTNSFELLTTIENRDTIRYELTEFVPLVFNYFRITVYDTLGLHSTGSHLSNALHTPPNAVNVNSVTYTQTEMTISWDRYEADLPRIQTMLKKYGQPADVFNTTDFVSYEILYAPSEHGQRVAVALITNLNSTSYTITDFDPTHENWYWITVTDYWGLKSTGNGLTQAIDLPPAAVDMTSVIYDTTSMYISWSMSEASDFASYKLMYMHGLLEYPVCVDSIFDIEATSYSLAEFNPLFENMFWVVTTDVWGLSSNSTMLGNSIDQPPGAVIQYPIGMFDDYYLLSWSRNHDDDFRSYDVYEWVLDDMSDKALLFTNNNAPDTTVRVPPIRKGVDLHYEVIARDRWGLRGTSNIEVLNIDVSFFKIMHDDYSKGLQVEVTQSGDYLFLGNIFDVNNLLKKTDRWGEVLWTASFPSVGRAVGMALTADEGCVVTGTANTLGARGADAWISKMDVNGNQEWTTKVGGDDQEFGQDIQQTSDGGYIITGYAETDNSADELFLFKADASGEEVWRRYFGQPGDDRGYSVRQTSEGGYIVVGFTRAEEHGDFNAWVLKTDPNGLEEWNFIMGGTTTDMFRSVRLTDDGGYIVGGSTSGEGFNFNMWLVKLDASGNSEWEKNYGGWSGDDGYHAEQTSDGGYIFTGITDDGDMEDIWVIKTDASGTAEWTHRYGAAGHDYGHSIKQTDDGGYVFAGYVDVGTPRAVLVKIDHRGKIFYPGTTWARP